MIYHTITPIILHCEADTDMEVDVDADAESDANLHLCMLPHPHLLNKQAYSNNQPLYIILLLE